ncbi:MAG TPA: DUF4160 domain-containing protein [Thermoguttaceae bacterium]|nr:DUF4160 domain-containing protein [Thermoguttaceae bacterium]HPP51344.1 DUF4160 domain-containing protein [Thermoguttaceae bacterium]
MPEICRFFGIVIKMHFGDHPPPHFHAEYEDRQAIIEINTLTVLGGNLPPRVLGLVMEWAWQHQTELLTLWDRAVNCLSLYKLPPLV